MLHRPEVGSAILHLPSIPEVSSPQRRKAMLIKESCAVGHRGSIYSYWRKEGRLPTPSTDTSAQESGGGGSSRREGKQRTNEEQKGEKQE